MLIQSALRVLFTKCGSVSKLVDNTSTVCPLLEKRRRDPRLEDEPAAEIDPADFLGVEVPRVGAFFAERLLLGLGGKSEMRC